MPGSRTPPSTPEAGLVPTTLSYLLEPADAPLEPALLQVGPDLGGDVQPRLGVVGDIAHEGKGLVGLQERKIMSWEDTGPPCSLGWPAAMELPAHCQLAH